VNSGCVPCERCRSRQRTNASAAIQHRIFLRMTNPPSFLQRNFPAQGVLNSTTTLDPSHSGNRRQCPTSFFALAGRRLRERIRARPRHTSRRVIALFARFFHGARVGLEGLAGPRSDRLSFWRRSTRCARLAVRALLRTHHAVGSESWQQQQCHCKEQGGGSTHATPTRLRSRPYRTSVLT